jgi:hypothetical protein
MTSSILTAPVKLHGYLAIEAAGTQRCGPCGFVADRDSNAAKNHERLAASSAVAACAEGTLWRGSQEPRETRLKEAGTERRQSALRSLAYLRLGFGERPAIGRLRTRRSQGLPACANARKSPSPSRPTARSCARRRTSGVPITGPRCNVCWRRCFGAIDSSE